MEIKKIIFILLLSIFILSAGAVDGVLATEKISPQPEILRVPISKEFGEKQRYIIIFKEKPVGYRNFVISLGGRVTHDYTIIEGITVEVPTAVAERLVELPNIKSIQLDELRFASLTESIPLINADDVQGQGITGVGVKVCIVDTGVDDTHSALNPLVAEYDFVNDDTDATDDEGHGTHVAGIIASQDTTYKGVSPGASLMAAKVLDATGSGWESDVIAGIDWCRDNGADIINLSLGGSTKFSSYCDSESDAQAINNAVDAGKFVAVASGNDAWTDGISSPACASKGTSVGAVYDANVGGISWSACTDSTTTPDKIVCFTNRGEILDLLAPGALIKSAKLGGGFVEYGGTSMAAPHVAGVAALLLESEPNLAPAQIEYVLRNTGVSIYDSGSGLTFPRIDVLAASDYLDSLSIAKIVFTTPPQTVFPGSVSGIMTIQTQSSDGFPVNVSADTTINLSTTASTGKFDTSLGGSFDGSVTSVVIAAGSNSASFYYKDETIGKHTVTASEAPDSGWADATQEVSVAYSQPDLTLSPEDISFTPSTPDEGQTVTISAVIHNNGIAYDDIDANAFAELTTGGNSGYYVDITQWDAQSFTATADSYLTKVSIAAWDVNANVADPAQFFKMSIQDDDNGKPDGSDLSSIESYDFAASTEWHDFIFSQPAKLTSGRKYWIVARSAAPDINGYAWRFNANPDRYAGGGANVGDTTDESVIWGTEDPRGDFWFKVYKYTYNTVTQFYDGDPDTGGSQIGENQYLPPIGVIDTKTASVTWTAVGGSHNIYVQVDRVNLINEANENNNKAYKTISVGGITLTRSGFPADLWQMISVPLEPENPDPEVILSDNLGDIFYNWTLARWQPFEGVYKYHKAVCCPWATSSISLLPNFSPGLGYWLITRLGPTDIDASGDLIPDSDYSIHLSSGTSTQTGGWNQIGVPFNYSVDWSSSTIKVKNTQTQETVDIDTAQANNWIENKIWWQNGTSTEYSFAIAPNGQLDPWQGYWVHNFIECDLIVSPTPVEGAGGQLASISSFTQEKQGIDKDQKKPGRYLPEWKIQLSIEKDTYNFAGISPVAKDDYDALDVLEPPQISKGINLYFSHQDWSFNPGNYTQDIRKSEFKDKEWNFEIKNELEQAPITLRWLGLEQIRYYDLSLTELDINQTIDIYSTADYTFELEKGGIRQFKLTAELKPGRGRISNGVDKN